MNELTRRLLRVAAVISIAWLTPAASYAQEEAEVMEEAEPRSYSVEVIIFRYAPSVSAGTEVFVPDPPPEIPGIGDEEGPVYGDLASRDLEPLDATGEPIGSGEETEEEPPAEIEFELLLEDELTMLSAWDRLDRLDAYEPLTHFGWRQAVIPFGEPVEISFIDLAEPVPGLEGSFKLYLSRFLHLAVAVELEADPDDPRNQPLPDPRDAPMPALGEPPLEGPIDAAGNIIVDTANDPYDMSDMPRGTIYYRINEDRIFKSGDLRYFDHPRFGVLAKIERVAEEDSEESDQDTLIPAGQPQ